MDEESKDYKREDWQCHYEENDLGWDLGQVAPPFVKLWEDEKLPSGKVLIPGCGRGHEVVFLAENGFVQVIARFLQPQRRAGEPLRLRSPDADRADYPR